MKSFSIGISSYHVYFVAIAFHCKILINCINIDKIKNFYSRLLQTNFWQNTFEAVPVENKYTLYRHICIYINDQIYRINITHSWEWLSFPLFFQSNSFTAKIYCSNIYCSFPYLTCCYYTFLRRLQRSSSCLGRWSTTPSPACWSTTPSSWRGK